jgi:heme exporter protein B
MISETTERSNSKETAAQTTPLSANTSFLSAVWAVFWKDLRIERHTRQIISIMVIFSIIAAVVFNFALGAATLTPNSQTAGNASMGFLWATILLAGTLGLNRSLSMEQENRSLEAVLLAPIDRSASYMGKILSITVFTLIVEAILIPIFIAFFNKPFWRPQVLGVLVLGTIGYLAAGVLVTSMSSQTRLKEVLLPVLLLPLTLPSLLSAGTATAALIRPELPAWSEIQFPIALVLVYDICMITAGFLTYHYVVEE